MLSSLPILAIGIMMALLEVPQMRKRKLGRELFLFTVLMILGVMLATLINMNIIINPLEGIASLYRPVTDYLLGLFQDQRDSV